MRSTVGQKGQIVIAKEFRDRLGVGPGWLALQRLVDDHVEVCFLPPQHRKSLKGSLNRHIKVSVPADEAWTRARESAWSEAAKEKVT